MHYSRYRQWQKAIGTPFAMSLHEIKKIGISLIGLLHFIFEICVSLLKICLSPVRWLFDPLIKACKYRDDECFWKNIEQIKTKL